ncbi:uncharacterized protein LOC133297736 [Gastrolobium bilobum]|uniref:uncharacterized protein LOC133297736 n=1 Tax=Gastrolobium bilobum TaxID=150636 RepID=UPI002AB30A13|nr:uncharacterized protein LOC133297736 [Gastrolobium bilobum]
MAHDVLDVVGCCLFPTTLKEVTLRWYSTLPPNSINNWEDFANQILVRFATSKAHYKSKHVLKTVKQGANETLRDFSTDFLDEALLVKDLDPQVSLYFITDSLLDGPFSTSLVKQRPKTIKELRARSEKFINLEDYKRSRGGPSEKLAGVTMDEGGDDFSRKRREMDWSVVRDLLVGRRDKLFREIAKASR